MKSCKDGIKAINFTEISIILPFSIKHIRRFIIDLMQVPIFKVFHPKGFSTMVLFRIMDVSYGSFQLGPPDPG